MTQTSKEETYVIHLLEAVQLANRGDWRFEHSLVQANLNHLDTRGRYIRDMGEDDPAYILRQRAIDAFAAFDPSSDISALFEDGIVSVENCGAAGIILTDEDAPSKESIQVFCRTDVQNNTGLHNFGDSGIIEVAHYFAEERTEVSRSAEEMPFSIVTLPNDKGARDYSMLKAAARMCTGYSGLAPLRTVLAERVAARN